MRASGGGNTRNVNLDRGTESLVWMMNEAENAGLKMDSKNLGYGVRRAEVIESLTGAWWIFEVLPLARVTYKSDRKRTIRLVVQVEFLWNQLTRNGFSRPHLGKGREIPALHKLHYSVLANHMQAEEQRYQPMASFGEPGSSSKVAWKEFFDDANRDEPTNTYPVEWEGDKRITKALWVVRSIDDIVYGNSISEDKSQEWLDNVSQLVSDSEFLWKQAA